MAKRRLTKEKRAVILRTIRERVRDVRFRGLKDAVAVLDAQLKDAAHELCCERFPAKDMAVLRRYKCTDRLRSLYVLAVSPSGSQRHDTMPLSADHEQPAFSQGRHTVVEWDHSIFKLKDKLDATQRQWREEVDRVMADYIAFVNDCRYFEDLVAIVPEVADLEKVLFCESTAVSTVSRDVLRRIQADQEQS